MNPSHQRLYFLDWIRIAAFFLPVLEGFMLVTLTLSLSFGIFEVVRRIPVLRPLFGLGRQPQFNSLRERFARYISASASANASCKS